MSKLLIQTGSSWNGNKLQPMNIAEPEVNVVKIVVPVGEKLPVHLHSVLNVGYLVKGELTVHTADGDTLVLKAGESIVEVVNVWHYGESTGTEPAEIVVVYVGEKGTPITVYKDGNV
jgi:quercetin dioxygenase-like cupin family protein